MYVAFVFVCQCVCVCVVLQSFMRQCRKCIQAMQVRFINEICMLQGNCVCKSVHLINACIYECVPISLQCASMYIYSY